MFSIVLVQYQNFMFSSYPVTASLSSFFYDCSPPLPWYDVCYSSTSLFSWFLLFSNLSHLSLIPLSAFFFSPLLVHPHSSLSQMSVFYGLSPHHQVEIYIGSRRKVSGQAKSAIHPDLLSRTWLMSIQDDGAGLTWSKRASERQDMCKVMESEDFMPLSLCTRRLHLACMS